MKIRRFLALLACAALGLCLCLPAAAYTPDNVSLTAPSAVVVFIGQQPSDDVTLFSQNADTRISPSATLRVLSTLVALDLIQQKGLGDATGTFTAELNNLIAYTGIGTAGMQIGDTWAVKDLLQVSYMATAADAAITLAETLAGSNAAFVQAMNDKAAALGCTDSHFTNVTALDDPNQYTSAMDLYRIMRAAMDDPAFVDIASKTLYKVGTQPYNAVNEMMSGGPNNYPAVLFGRTGGTGTGYNMVQVAQSNGYKYLVVVMDSHDPAGTGGVSTTADKAAAYADAKALFGWAFNNFTYKTIIGKNTPVDSSIKLHLSWSADTVTLVPAADVAALVPNDLPLNSIQKVVTLNATEVNAPITKGQVLGKVTLYINVDEKIAEADLVADQSMPASKILTVWAGITGVLSSPWLYLVLAVIIVLITAYIVLNIVHNKKKKKKTSGLRLRK
ncbi:MAG: hypothetical protein FWF49_03570 [Oscillospiraceae bacterium]|nr:hypothetical protein [Oscillospiraceae bacterium]